MINGNDVDPMAVDDYVDVLMGWLLMVFDVNIWVIQNATAINHPPVITTSFKPRGIMVNHYLFH